MPFLRANIDRSIVMTQYDLRGFSHPLGPRMKPGSPKYLYYATSNLLPFAAGVGRDSRGTDENYVEFFKSSFEDYLAMCKRLADDCDLSQREAIRLIVEDMVKQHGEIGEAIASGKREKSGYHKPIDKDNEWGRAILALQEAFAPSPEEKAQAA